MRILKKIILNISSVGVFCIAVCAIFIVADAFARPILTGKAGENVNQLIGNDSGFALSLVYWFNRFYPEIPIWYPLQGMGVSLFYSYPMLTTFSIIIIDRFSDLSAVQVFRLLSFLAFPLTAIGVYFFTWTRFKNSVISFAAAIFYLISQAVWLFQTLHGIFAQSFSMVFVPVTLAFFGLYLDKTLQYKSTSYQKRLFFAITCLLLAVTFLTHVVTGTLVSLTILVWGTVRYMLRSQQVRLREAIVNAVGGLSRSLPVVVLGVGVSAFWFIPFSSYTALANKEGLNTMGVSQLQEVSLKISTLLGMGAMGQGDLRYDFFFFASPVLIFFVVGSISAVLLKKKTLIVLSLIAIFFVSLTTIPLYLPGLVGLFKYFFTGVYFRGLIPVFILLPIVAAWGVWSVFEILIALPIDRFNRMLPQNAGTKILAKFIAVFGKVSQYFLTILVVTLSILHLGHTPPPGKYQFQPYGPALTNDFDNLLDNPVNYLSSISKSEINPAGLEKKANLNDEIDKILEIDDRTVLDVSPFAAGGAIVQGAGLTSDTRWANLYHYYASLIHGMWGYQAGVFFGQEPLYKAKNLLEDLSHWYGFKYVVVVDGFDPIQEKYEPLGWKRVSIFSDRNGEIWENPAAEGLYTLTSRPSVLVITNEKKGGYDQVFRSANLGALSYENAIIIKGDSNRIDDYTLEDLAKFSGIIAHGYSYKNKSRAWSLLNDYVESGGFLFIDTGWQYVARDWESVSDISKFQPNLLPVTDTALGEVGTDWNTIHVARNITYNSTDFDPLVWDKNPWGISLADKIDLAQDSEALIWTDDKVLMAKRKVGKGTVVWSGMNIFSHITQKMNEDEADMLKSILAEIYAGKENITYENVGYTRNNPDTIEFDLPKTDKPAWLIFRESVSPYWKIENNDEKVDYFTGGPGFVVVYVPQSSLNQKIDLMVKLNFKDGIFAKSVTLSSLIILCLYLFIGDKFKLPGGEKVKKHATSIRKHIGNNSEEDEY
ncbi:hypothetical protein IPM62_01670 [Candidatus Woesebacteria bacterium]|nr:MAG: hypothetical protein IPM62_01670 [Candidatus Woesebacteria bacterium]